MSEAEPRERIARKLMVRDGLNDDLYYDCRRNSTDLSIGETILRYEAEAEQWLSILAECGYLPVEPAQLEVLGDEEIRRQIQYLYENNPYTPIEVMLIALCQSISIATNTHNEAKFGKLYKGVK